MRIHRLHALLRRLVEVVRKTRRNHKFPRYLVWAVIGGIILLGLHSLNAWAQGAADDGAITTHTSISLDVAVLVGSGIVTVLVALAAVRFHVKDMSVHHTTDELAAIFVERIEFQAWIEDSRADRSIIKELMANMEQQLPDKIALALYRDQDKRAGRREPIDE